MGRPAIPNINPYPDILALTDMHKHIAQLQVAGMKKVDIARNLGVSPSLISALQKSDLYRTYKASLQSQAEAIVIAVRQRASLLCKDALDVAATIMRDESEKSSVRLKAAQAILSGNGLQSPEKQGGTHVDQVNIQLNSTDSQTAREALQAFMREFSKGKAA